MTTPTPSYFEHSGLRLAPLSADDLEFAASLRNDRTTWAHLSDPRPTCDGEQERFLKSLGSQSGRLYFTVRTQVIEEREDEPAWIEASMRHALPFALVRMDQWDTVHRSIRVGADVASHSRGKGFGTRIYQAIKALCFDQYGLHKLWLQVLEDNEVAIHLYKAAGFQVTGRLREAIYRDGRWKDYLLMDLLEREYRAPADAELMKQGIGVGYPGGGA